MNTEYLVGYKIATNTKIDELASNNIKKFAFINLKNTAGIVGINACGDGAIAPSEKQEAHSALAKG